MNIQSGRTSARRIPTAPVSGRSPMSKVKPVLFILFMIIMVACVCELHIYFKSGISSLSLEIDSTKRNIAATQREIESLRTKIEMRNRWSYISRQIDRFGLKMVRPAPGQMHTVAMLPAQTIRLAADRMRYRENAPRAAMLQKTASRKINKR